jgi:hypothetical protein
MIRYPGRRPSSGADMRCRPARAADSRPGLRGACDQRAGHRRTVIPAAGPRHYRQATLDPILWPVQSAYVMIMRPLRDFLARFRPAGTPGAARAGVPADRSLELEAEVGPVLALLDGTYAERGRIVAQARRDADWIVAAAEREAAAIAADAGQRARAAREEAARQVMALARDEAARTVGSARQQATRTRELARQRMPALVNRTVDTIRQLQSENP